jgi:hypothetical protein
MKMYVWHPRSLEDYSSGMVCVIAESKAVAILLAVEDRFPYYTEKQHKRGTSPLSLEEINANIRVQRNTYRDELKKERADVIRRGAVYIAGGS